MGRPLKLDPGFSVTRKITPGINCRGKLTYLAQICVNDFLPEKRLDDAFSCLYRVLLRSLELDLEVAKYSKVVCIGVKLTPG